MTLPNEPGSPGVFANGAVTAAMVGGTISKLQGGRFGHGALSAGINKLASPAIQNMGGSSYYQGAVSAIVGGSVSSISGGKFANGAATAAMAYAFNQMTQSGKEAARAKGEERAGPYLSGYDTSSDQYHEYSVGPTALCALSTEGCSYSALAPIVGGESVPFTLSYSGEGGYNLPYGMGLDPIIHRTPEPGIWLNITDPGHRYHPGSVVHSVHESGGKLWLYTKGAGVGPNPGQNVSVGRFLFGNMHIDVQNQMIQQQTGYRTPPWIP